MIQEGYTRDISLYAYVTIGEKDDASPNRSKRVRASRSRPLPHGKQGPREGSQMAKGELAMMVPEPTYEQGKEIDCYLDSRPKVATAQLTNPAIVEIGKQDE